MPTFEAQSQLSVPADALYDYHRQPGAFNRLTPPASRMEVLRATGGIEDGAERLILMKQGPVAFEWLARHCDHIPGAGFSDIMVRGPFKRWRHDHLFLPEAEGSVLIDRINYALPLGHLLNGLVRRQLTELFRFRHWRTAMDLDRQAPYRGLPAQEVVLCGRPNRFSRNLAAFLSTAGHQVYHLGYDRGLRARHVFRDFFSGEVCHPLEDAHALIYTGVIPRSAIDGPDDPLAFWDFLDRVLRTLVRKPALFLSLHHQQLPSREDALDLSPHGSSRLRDYRQNEQTQQMLEIMGEHVERTVVLHLATVIGETLPQWVDTLLYLESFLFLAEGVPTPEFDWIALDDVFAAVLHVLAQPGLNGSFAAYNPTPSSRAAFQKLLLERHLIRSSWLRMLKVQPWAKPGHSSVLHPELKSLTPLTQTGYKPLTTTLADVTLS